MLPFELRDLKNDNPNLGTIPQLIGVKGTKQLSVWLTLVIIALSLINVTNHKHLIIAIIFVMITMTTTLMYSKKKSRFYTAFFVESLPIFWLLTLFSF
jgi:4-hydroxybenzoate polyprenyltransferase